jgi:hypothetical protein
MSLLKPEISIPAALALGVACYGIFQVNLPSITETRAADMADPHIESAERAATWECAGLVSTLSLIAKDPTIFTIGGLITIALAWKYRHANAVNPMTGKATGPLSTSTLITAQAPTAAPAAMAPAPSPYSSVI